MKELELYIQSYIWNLYIINIDIYTYFNDLSHQSAASRIYIPHLLSLYFINFLISYRMLLSLIIKKNKLHSTILNLLFVLFVLFSV